MKFIGWIEIDQRLFSVSRSGKSFVVQKYLDGKKIEGANSIYTEEEFERFIDELPISQNKFKWSYEF